MANYNNTLFNAALVGFCAGCSGAWLQSTTPTDYAAFKAAGIAFATAVDSIFGAYDPDITTSNVNPSMLVDTGSNTIQAETQFRPALLTQICAGALAGRFDASVAAQSSGYWLAIANRIGALYEEMLPAFVIP